VIAGEKNSRLALGGSNVKSIVLVLGVGLATLGLTSSASAQSTCCCSQTVYYSYAASTTSYYNYPASTTSYYSYPTYTSGYSYPTYTTSPYVGTWGGMNVYVRRRSNYDGGPRYVRYGNVIINRARWGDLQNYVSYGDLIRR
jgi:hypothetical protein